MPTQKLYLVEMVSSAKQELRQALAVADAPGLAEWKGRMALKVGWTEGWEVHRVAEVPEGVLEVHGLFYEVDDDEDDEDDEDDC